MIIWETYLLILLGLAAIGGMSGMVGVFAFLGKKTLVGDAVSHSVLPGLVVGFILTGTKDPLLLLLGGAVTGFVSVLLIDYIEKYTKLSSDTAIALVTSIFFAGGSVLLSYVSNFESGNQSGLKDFLFGKAATLTQQDVSLFLICFALVVLSILLLFKPLKSLSFSRDFAIGQGWPVRFLEYYLAMLTAVVITLGLQAVGVVLMSAMLISPAALSRYWTNSLIKMLVLAGASGILAAIAGGLLSLVQENMPTGPWIIMVIFVFTFLTLLFAPQKGWLAIRKRNARNAHKMSYENLLKTLEQLREDGTKGVTKEQILDRRRMPIASFEKALKYLGKKDWVEIQDGQIELTQSGVVEAQRVVRLHRLWELYLTARMNFKDDHIHGTAETIEHVLTEEMEALLLKELDFPEKDPHQKNIPYGSAQ